MELLDENGQLVLVQARRERSINNAAVQALTGLHRADVTQLLAGLRSRGLLEQESSRRWAVYRLPERVIQAYHEIPLKKTLKDVKVPLKKNSQVVRAILALCRTPRSSAELAIALKKNRVYVVQQYLSPMVKEGLLAYTRPDAPKAKGQKYIAKSHSS